MGSYPMRDGVHDFDADATNDFKDTRRFSDSGMKAGVESGLGSYEAISRGSIQPEQASSGNTFRQDYLEEATDSKNGKNFKFTR